MYGHAVQCIAVLRLAYISTIVSTCMYIRMHVYVDKLINMYVCAPRRKKQNYRHGMEMEGKPRVIIIQVEMKMLAEVAMLRTGIAIATPTLTTIITINTSISISIVNIGKTQSMENMSRITIIVGGPMRKRQSRMSPSSIYISKTRRGLFKTECED